MQALHYGEAHPATTAIVWAPLKVKGSDIDAVFLNSVSRNAEHPDVKSLPTDELVENLRKTKMQLRNEEKTLSQWLPGVRPGPSVTLISTIAGRLLSLIKEVTEHMSCFAKLDSPEKAAKAAANRHYRYERDKVTHGLYEDHKVPVCVSKVVGDVYYETLVPPEEAGVVNSYQKGGIEEEPSWNEPFFIPPESAYVSDTLEIHHMCWNLFTAPSARKELAPAEAAIKDRMTQGRIAVGRMRVQVDAFKWPEPLHSPPVPPFLQVQSTERFNCELKAWPIRMVSCLCQVMSGTFFVTILEPDKVLKHTNIAQWIHAAETTEFAKTWSFMCRTGSAFYVPFGWLVLTTAVTAEYCSVVLGTDLKAKQEASKRKPVAQSTGSFMVYPLFDGKRHQSEPDEVVTIASYSWAQAQTWIPEDWKVAGRDYWKIVTEAKAQSAAADKE